MSKRRTINPGDVFGRLTVVREIENVRNSYEITRYVICTCACGSGEKTYRVYPIFSGKTRSCGCLFREANTLHGMTGTRPFNIWFSMLERCTNINNSAYKNYGGRGITVSQEWMTFSGFWNDMEEGYSDELEIDRVDNSLGYSKENCRWTTGTIQNFNRRKLRNNSSGGTGVYWIKKLNKWLAQISHEKKITNSGYYTSFEDAVKARAKAEIDIYGVTKNE